MDASRLTPPLRLDGGTLLDLEVVVRGTVRRLSSSLHAVSMTLDDGAVRVAPSQQATLDRDFVLAVTFGDAEQSGARAWTDGAHTLLVLEPPVDALPPACHAMPCLRSTSPARCTVGRWTPPSWR